MPPTPPVSLRPILVLNGYQDVVEMLRFGLEAEGLPTVTGSLDRLRRGQGDLTLLLTSHDPAVVVYDIAPPYEQSWNYLQSLRSSGPLQGRRLVLTTTNERRLREMVPVEEPVIEIFGKPYDIRLVVEAVQRALRSPTDPPR